MTQLLYDESFEGMLSAVFEVFERKLVSARIVRRRFYQPELHSDSVVVEADLRKSERVWNGLKGKLSAQKRNEIYKTFLSEQHDMEDVLLSFIRYVFHSSINIEKDYGHQAVLAVSQIAKKVHREKHRMEAFVRFERTRDDLYFASVEPDFNVLPLIASHFKDRYTDQHWAIYDRRRNYGIHYNKDLRELLEVEFEYKSSLSKQVIPASATHEHEYAYQTLWKDYFQSVNISSRKNPKLHIQHVPARYWKYLTEKRSV